MNLMLPVGVRIFVANEPTDLRHSFDTLAVLARSVVKQDPMSGHLFVFHNKAGNRVKILFWDRTGWVLWYKRMERGLFRFPERDEAALEVDPTQLRLLLDGIPLGPRIRRARHA